jgi:hypothetical protein
MVMDYGAAGPYVCVVNKTTGKCDMGASAIAAADSLAAAYQVWIERGGRGGGERESALER